MPPCKITLLQVCSQLLASPGEELQVHFFAAQTLRRKTQRQLAALNDYQRQELGNSLVTYINQHSAEQMAAVVIQLCLALASLIVQAENWTDVLKTLSEPPKQHKLAQLQFAPAFPTPGVRCRPATQPPQLPAAADSAARGARGCCLQAPEVPRPGLRVASQSDRQGVSLQFRTKLCPVCWLIHARHRNWPAEHAKSLHSFTDSSPCLWNTQKHCCW